jgi:hypothetical protein
MSLAFIRMVTMYIALMDSGERPAARFLPGWFGPREPASLAFAVSGELSRQAEARKQE